ncbi:endolytic transglycosylase MltG [Actinoplanes subtropicus]|uniref:endolytic transglycosylase MltG n=1 Tax=Actinoplanes subtropicus TaxID=543632 RepID=UPI0004C45603|nr:endolytic transglycosylase MltG [Actinoplanes subtropicus]
MIDELDLAFDEHADRGKPRHRRGSRGGKKGSGKSGIAFVMAFILLAVLGGGVYFGYSKVKGFFVAADYSGTGTTAVSVTIAKGSSLTDIGNTLVDADVVKSTKAFVNAANDNPRGKNIQSGTYNLKKQMSAKNAVTALLDPKSRITSGITIPEGKTVPETFELLSKATKIPVKDFQDAAKDPVGLGIPAYWFNRRDGKTAIKTVEGFLFPDTYEFDPKLTAAQILSAMIQRFLTVTQDLNFVDTVQNNLSISPNEALVAASIAQAEALKDEDMPKVVKVLYNRAYSKKFPCNCLGLDSTVNYWLKVTGKGGKASEHLTVSEMHDPKNPFNTYDKPGMPPGAIGSPGKAALQGAMNPPANFPYFYFISIDKQGTMAYAKTYAEHNANKQLACRNGIPLCG